MALDGDLTLDHQFCYDVIMMIDQHSSPQRGTGLAFVQHWDWVAEKGLLPKNTALSIRTSVSKILGIEEEWESVDVRRLDVDALIARFRNASNLAPNSLATYKSRFRTGLASYLAYLDNPTSYQPKGRRRSVREDGAGAREEARGSRPVRLTNTLRRRRITNLEARHWSFTRFRCAPRSLPN